MTIRKVLALFAICAVSAQPQPDTGTARDLVVGVGRSLLIDSPVTIQRISVGDPEIAEAVATSPKEILVNGRKPGETTVIVWQETGSRLIFDLTVQRSAAPLEAVRRQLRNELRDEKITIDLENDVPVVSGVATNLTAADRALALAGTLGKPINLLNVNVPDADAQILIQVRFANVDRGATTELGLNLFSTGAANTIGAVSTGQFRGANPSGTIGGRDGAGSFTLSDALNLFWFSPNLNLGATIKALQSKSLLQVLAEPNVLALNGKEASFLAGGEFPYPTLQGGGAGLGAVTIQFREFGIRINFVPVVTPRGSIRMRVTPEVSSLDYANGLVFQGVTIPGLATRRVSTEIELQDGQSFAIGGLLDNRITSNLSKIPGLGDIPFFGKLFQSKQLLKNNSELLVMVTPQIVYPIPAGQPRPELKMPQEFMAPNTSNTPPQTPGVGVTGKGTPRTVPAVPMEQLIQSMKQPQGGTQQSAPSVLQFVPMYMPEAVPQPAAPAKAPDSIRPVPIKP
jgi:pilus assembly protein CpaC